MNTNKCTCGHRICSTSSELTSTNSGSSSNEVLHEQKTFLTNNNNNNNNPLDASFVQIPFHIPEDISSSKKIIHNHNDSIQNTNTDGIDDNNSCNYREQIELLEKAALSPENPPPLCTLCVQRIEYALNKDTERLVAETRTYQESIREDIAWIEGWKLAIQRSKINEGEEVLAGCCEVDDDAVKSVENAYRNEITALEEQIQNHKQELADILALQREHAMVEAELDRYQDAIAQEQIALQLEARAFDNEQEKLSRVLDEIHQEVERLSSTNICLPETIVHVQVDTERGLRYPLVNELRLAFRPKGDVQWSEIQAAWALAAHLLLIVGTLFDFQSQHWKIIPLSHCAKLIYQPPARNTADNSEKKESSSSHPMVFNLGHPKTNGCKALLTFNALLYQIIQHVKLKFTWAAKHGILDHVPEIPFDLSPTTIGKIAITKLNESDDAAWSRVIHYIASDLLWLSECSSMYMLQQVLFAASMSGRNQSTTDQGGEASCN